MKRQLSLLLITLLLISILIPNQGFAKNEQNFLSPGKTLEQLGVLKGTLSGDLLLDENLLRRDMVVLISRLYKQETSAKSSLAKPKFKDVLEGDPYYIPYIGWAVDKGLIKGMDNETFGYDRNVTVQEFQVVLLRALAYDEEASIWKNVPGLAEKLGLMNDLNLKPKDDLQRGQMAQMTLNALRLTKKGSSLTLAQVLNLELPNELGRL